MHTCMLTAQKLHQECWVSVFSFHKYFCALLLHILNTIKTAFFLMFFNFLTVILPALIVSCRQSHVRFTGARLLRSHIGECVGMWEYAGEKVCGRESVCVDMLAIGFGKDFVYLQFCHVSLFATSFKIINNNNNNTQIKIKIKWV